MVIPISDHNPTRRVPVVTIALITINVAVFLLANLRLPTDELTCFTFRYAAIPPELLDLEALSPRSVPAGAPACLAPALAAKNVALSALTSMFLHGDLWHLLFNLLFLWVFGNNVEDDLGHVPYLLFYVLAGLISVYAFALLNADAVVPLLGASGAISAVLGGYLVLHPRARVNTYVPFPLYLVAAILPRARIVSWFLFFAVVALPAWAVLSFWFVTQLLALDSTVGGGGGVAYEAHVAGFVVGVLFTLVLRRRRPAPRPAWPA